jgi:hypothetical protein
MNVIRVSVYPQVEVPFTVRIANVSNDSTLMPSDGSKQFVPMAPGVWAVHMEPGALFNAGEPDRGDGLEALAEDGDPSGLGTALGSQDGILSSGVFNTPAGASEPGALLPENNYEFTFDAVPGSYLSFATMFVPSNDLFYGPAESGIPLFDDMGKPKAGDLTAYVMLWDAGTEENQEPGVGADQAQRQSGADVGADDPDNTVRLVNDSFTYPDNMKVIRVTLYPHTIMPFTVRIENVSTATTLMPSDGSMQPVPMAPGAWALHSSPGALFTTGETDRGDGLEALGEDGDPSGLAAALAYQSGIVASGVFNTPVGAEGPGPLVPGGIYEFSFEASYGFYFSFATMFIPSNDLFYGPDDKGIPLFDETGDPKTGDVTMYVMLWDPGTEENQEPGVGADQAQRQSGPNTGAADSDNTVRLVNDSFTYPDVANVIKVTINEPWRRIIPIRSIRRRQFVTILLRRAMWS